MGTRKIFECGVLASLTLAVAAAYGAVALAPGEKHAEPEIAWVALPEAPPPINTVASIDADVFRMIAPPSAKIAPVSRPASSIAAPRLTDLKDKLDAANFDLRAVRESGRTVPRLFVQSVPGDFADLTNVGELKRTYIKMVLPLALKVNEEIRRDRNRLLQIKGLVQSGRELSATQQAWLADTAAIYDLEVDDIDQLIARHDVISPALAVAQSAEESGWGRSRFALKGNALFGQRTWDEGLGLVPHEREENLNYEVRSFDTLLDSVRSYARNLNGHFAYDDFRSRRAQMRTRTGELDPYSLVETLTAYSERGEDYIEAIKTILRVNKLEQFEGSRLQSLPVETTFLQTDDGQR